MFSSFSPEGQVDQQAARFGVFVARHLAPLPPPDDRHQGHAAARQGRVQNGQKGRETRHK